MIRITTGLLWTLLFCQALLFAEDEPKDDKSKLNSGTISALNLREIGPALMSGRVSDIAIDPEKENTWYVAVGSGNLWKTTNAGTTWKPIFDNYGSYSIGCVTIDPNNHNTIWVGSGEAVGGRHVGYGDGVYRSLDGGKSFKNLGLKESEHIAKILVHPSDSDTVYVAAQGPLWSPGGERGLYKTTDGGKTWDAILTAGEYTGATDIAFDPRDADTIYAVLHQRHRTVWSLVNGGPESGIRKSTDGGKTWKKLNSGLPGGDKGKIAVAVSPIKPDVVYATIELAGRTGGFWRSEDAGESWKKMDDYISGGTGPHYYQEIWCDPHRFDVVYQANVRLGRTEDGGKTWESVNRPAKHVDNHAVAFKKSDPDFLLVGCDGGLYASFDYAETYAFKANLPVTQFYKISADNDFPFYNVVGGTQDNNTIHGPVRTSNSSGIRNSDWRITIGGDGHDCAIDPEDPETMYCESQQGYLRRYDRRSGQSVDIRPQPEKGEEAFRFNWDSPILISPHSHTRLYFGSRRLHRSDDRGDSWTSISPDLSRNQDRYQLKVMGRVWSINAIFDLYAMSQYGNITSISESPVEEGLIYVGTDDGLIQITEDGGEKWRRIDRIYGIPEYSFVNDVKADRHDADTVYAVFDNHKRGDFKPYLVKSTDRGQSWESIAGDLPDRHIVWRFEQDHEKPELCFVGTEFGLFFTLDNKKWIKLGAGAPNIPFRDLEIQKRESDLIGATFGRSFYVLDDYSPLRLLSEELLTDNELVLFPVRRALQYIQDSPLGGRRGTQGDALYAAANPEYGAVFTYYLRDSLKTREAKRKEREGKTKKAGGDNMYPGWDEIEQEEREESPSIFFTIKDPKGNVVDRVTGASSAGMHRVAWDLRYAPLGGRGGGPMVLPGEYEVSASKRVDDKEEPLGEPQTFEVVSIVDTTLEGQSAEEVLAFQRQAGELARTVRGARSKVSEVLEQLKEIKEAVETTDQPDSSLYDAARELELKLLEAEETLAGDDTRSDRSVDTPPSITDRVFNAAFGSFNNTYGPTKTHERSYEIAREEFEELLPTLKTLIEGDFEKLKDDLDEAGIAWTAGRELPELQPE